MAEEQTSIRPPPWGIIELLVLELDVDVADNWLPSTIWICGRLAYAKQQAPLECLPVVAQESHAFTCVGKEEVNQSLFIRQIVVALAPGVEDRALNTSRILEATQGLTR